eukprot:4188024-Pyramimonas_sp.AAC.1
MVPLATTPTSSHSNSMNQKHNQIHGAADWTTSRRSSNASPRLVPPGANSSTSGKLTPGWRSSTRLGKAATSPV